MTTHTKSARSALVTALFCSSILPLGATVIIADNFSGSSATPLNGTTASTFDSAITTAGGNGIWDAHSLYNANGTLTSSSGVSPQNIQSTSAILGLGTYIWDTRGTENGLFTLTATFSAIGGGSSSLASRWVSLGFFSSEPSQTQAFYSVGGVATAVHRQNDASSNNYFAGPLTSGESNPGVISGTATLTIVIDLRSWDGPNGNYGTVTFSNSVTSGSTTAALPSNGGLNPFQYLGFSGNTNSSSDIGPSVTMTNFSLTQIPEPATALLAPIGLAALLRRRRLP